MEKKKREIVIRHPVCPKSILRVSKDGVQAGELQPLAEGKPIHGEVVQLSETPLSPMVYECETLVEGQGEVSSSGPAQVATPAYRNGWEQTFGSGTEDSSLAN